MSSCEAPGVCASNSFSIYSLFYPISNSNKQDIVGRSNFVCRPCRGLKSRVPPQATIQAAIEAANAGAAPSDWAKRAAAALEALSKKKAAHPFLEPVPRSLSDYYELIKTPMDLGTVGQKLKKSRYQSLDEVIADVALVSWSAKRCDERYAVVTV